MLDFWDLTKLLGRQWRISLPMLLVTAVLTVLTVTHVKPNYVSTAYIQLVAPTPPQATATDPTPATRNPWVGQGLQTIGNAALISVQDLSYVHALTARGLSDKFTAQMGGDTPLITLAVTGNTRAQAAATATQMVGQFSTSLHSLQIEQGVATVDLITDLRLDSGSNITVSSSKIKRAIVIVVGLGLLLTVAITVGADAWMRRRARLSAADASNGSESSARPSNDVPATSWRPRTVDGGAALATEPAPVAASGVAVLSDDADSAILSPEPAASTNGQYKPSADATIVLPRTVLVSDDD
jgi:capsular polysaccharide biosynthesis protein